MRENSQTNPVRNGSPVSTSDSLKRADWLNNYIFGPFIMVSVASCMRAA